MDLGGHSGATRLLFSPLLFLKVSLGPSLLFSPPLSSLPFCLPGLQSASMLSSLLWLLRGSWGCSEQGILGRTAMSPQSPPWVLSRDRYSKTVPGFCSESCGVPPRSPLKDRGTCSPSCLGWCLLRAHGRISPQEPPSAKGRCLAQVYTTFLGQPTSSD